ncbi:methyltransferase domain-containing protein [candidate division KSB1 bacterium]|nr:methyltransferase domain-containing protein [candidate division KSB1 bacterium]
MPHVFNPKELTKLDQPERVQLINPKSVLQKMGIAPGQVVLDFGCGTGVFTVTAAEIIGPQGYFYAVDIFPEMLQAVAKKFSGQSNLQLIQISDHRLPLENNRVDFVFMGFVLHEVVEKEKTLQEIHRILRPTGKIGIIDWDTKTSEKGPPLADRVPLAEATAWLAKTGFQQIQAYENSIYHYYVIATKT